MPGAEKHYQEKKKANRNRFRGWQTMQDTIGQRAENRAWRGLLLLLGEVGLDGVELFPEGGSHLRVVLRSRGFGGHGLLAIRDRLAYEPNASALVMNEIERVSMEFLNVFLTVLGSNSLILAKSRKVAKINR